MKRKFTLDVECLEARETPDVSLTSLGAGMMAAQKQALAGACGRQLDASFAAVLHEKPCVAPAPAQARDGAETAALQALFSNSRELEKLLAPSSQDFPATVHTISREGSDRKGAASAHSSLPSHLAPLPREAEGLQFLNNYTRKAIRNAEQRFGPLDDHEDIVQQVFLEWREQVGPGEFILAALLLHQSGERLALRQTVRRVIDQARYQRNKRRRLVELVNQPAPVNDVEEEWTDLLLDWTAGAHTPSPRARHLLELRRQGMSFDEIGDQMGMVKQRVSEIYNATLDRLKQVYSASLA
jgi:DNA-directed RNA polymerase specialized sigma24 family protein